MKQNPLLHLLLLAFTLVSLSCNKSLEDYFNPDGIADHVYRGPIVKMGNGQVRSFFTVGPTGVPLKIGVEMNDAALEGLPTDPTDFMGNLFELSIPQKAKDMTAFNHLTVDWNPHGHDPEHVYDKPHFDFHFYKISPAARKSIPPYTAETAALFDKLPPAGYMPTTFVPTPGGVPGMGKHWVSTEGDEANGIPFTKTFIYGSYNGEVNFVEPMVTLELLKSGVQSSTAVAQPTHFAPDSTYYPTTYEITRDSQKKLHTVALTDFVWREGAN